MRRSTRALCATLTTAILLATPELAGQYFPTPAPPPNNTPAPIAASGVVPANPAVEAKMRQQVNVPAGFDVTLFAGPPIAMYPTCVADSPDGAIFVCVDPNSSLSRIKGVGRVMRLVDENNDGRADRYTVFAEMDSPRGIVSDGETVYVMHPPTLTALRDTNGDGIADWSRELVTGLGYDLDFRGADHTTNQIQFGADGWIYVAVGDYGFHRAVGADGTEISYRGGAVVRVRPDGSNLEIYATGTRNTYDIALSPFLEVFARDNTNDGDGWDTRLHYLPPGAFMGYPTHYRNFASETFPTLHDYGPGSGVGALWVQDPAWPEPFRNTLVTADWTLNKIFTHPLSPRGSIFDVQQNEFITMVRPTDLVMDARSNLYVASLSGGQYQYVADTIGYVFRVTPTGAATNSPQVRALADAQLVNLLTSPNMVHRTYAQQELVRRGTRDASVRALEQLMQNQQQVDYARVAAMFTYKQILGAEANAGILRLASAPDARVRAAALRALADRKDQLEGVSADLFVRGLSDADDHVKIQAINGLLRLGAVDAADALIPLTASRDQGIAHLAVNALVGLGAREAALRALEAGNAETQTGALRMLARMHDQATVSALLARLERTQAPATRRELLAALARLHHREGVWLGDWWTTRPSFLGPYYAPTAWEGSPRIRATFRRALLQARGEELTFLTNTLVQNRVLPQGSESLVLAVAASPDANLEDLVDGLLGLADLNDAALDALARLNEAAPALRGEVVGLIAAQTRHSRGAIPLLRNAALDGSLLPDVRERVLNAIGAVPGIEGTREAAPIFARLNPVGGGEDSPIDAAWRRWVGNNRRNQELDHFVELTRSAEPSERVLAYSVLLQRVRAANTPQATRDRVNPVIESALSRPADARELAQAVTIMRLENEYGERLRAAGVVATQ